MASPTTITDQEMSAFLSKVTAELRELFSKSELHRDTKVTDFRAYLAPEPGSPPHLLQAVAETSIYVEDDNISTYYSGNRTYFATLAAGVRKIASTNNLVAERRPKETIYFGPKKGSAFYRRVVAYLEFHWMREIIAPEFSDIYDEFFAYFSKRPERLHDLNARQFEQLIAAIFSNNGFRTELGPGWRDGGVDIRLYQHDAIGELATLVQVKKYSPDRPIRLEPVAALRGVLERDGASRGLFVTSSHFLPSARKFADLSTRRIELAARDEVQQWCGQLSKRLKLSGFGRLTKPCPDLSVAGETRDRPESAMGKIFERSYCGTYDTLHNEFFMVVRESANAVLLVQLKTQERSEESLLDGRPYLGSVETPLADETSFRNLRKKDLSNREFRRARKLVAKNVRKVTHLYGEGFDYWLWSGKPLPCGWMK